MTTANNAAVITPGNPLGEFNIDVRPADLTERPVLRHLMELYLYDFSQFDGADVGPSGLYEYPYLDHYWVEPERSPFLVRVGGSLAGFVLVARYNYLTGMQDAWLMAEFFILRKYRTRGIGEYVARHIFDRFPGPWQVGQISENTDAAAFWRKVIDRYTHGSFQEYQLDSEHWCGPVQAFMAPSHSTAAEEADKT